MSPDISSIREAALRIRTIAKHTQIITSRSFDEQSGVRTVFKPENFQTGGAFKIRGAANLIFSLSAGERAKGVIAYSSGNHAQATAIAARETGTHATIIMPADAPRSKLEATRGYGAQVVTYDRHTENREQIAAEILARTGAELVPPFDHPMIVSGQGTAGLELIDDASDLDAVIAPVGGGGLLSGCAIAAKALKPGIRVFGAEPAGANDTYLSFRAGHRIEVRPDTIADGLRSPMPGQITFPIIRQLAEDILLVSEEEIGATVKFLMTRLKIVVEPSGAVAAAAVLHRKLPAGVQSVGVVLSGGNVDYETLAAL